MVSDKQHKANQQNSATGGVKTPEGKAVSKFNALTHGILRDSLTEYEKEFYPNVIQDLQAEFNPQGIVEQILVERIAVSYLKLFRAQKAETEYMKSNLNPHYESSYGSIEINYTPRVIRKGYKPKIIDEQIEKLSNIYGRYETTLENRFFRALHELERAQRARKGEKLSFPKIVDVNQMGSFGENDKGGIENDN